MRIKRESAGALLSARVAGALALNKLMSLCIPENVLDQHLVVLGKTGAGKSSALRHIVENLLDRKKRVCIVDPKGDWNGLKVSADGKRAGYPVILFGDFKETAGQAIHADVPLNEFSGKHIGELVTSGNRPCVIGFRGWTMGNMHRFWIDFASTIFNSNEGEFYLVIDEVHNFAPKGKIMSPEVGKCLHWANRIMNEGRGIGLVNLIASQRPQKVHNDTLTACETLVAMRVIHKADRDAVEDWIKGCGDSAQGKEVLNALAGMNRGEAYVWSPEAKFGPERLSFPMFRTFDSFAPPQLQKKVSGKDWSTVDLGEVREKLAGVIEQAKAKDPDELNKTISQMRQQVATLERDLKRARETREVLPTAKPAKPKVVEKRIMAVQAINRLEKLLERAEEFAKAGPAVITELRTAISEGKALNAEQGTYASISRSDYPGPVSRPPMPQPSAPVLKLPRNATGARSMASGNGDFKPSRKQQEIMDALAWFDSIGNAQPSGLQVGAIALIDASGGHFSNTVGPLSANGLIERGQGRLWLTDKGRTLARVPDHIASLDEYHNVLRSRVRRAKSAGGKTIDILNVIIRYGGSEVSTETIGHEAGIDHTGGHFSNMIGPLSTVGLIERRSGMVRPTEILFPQGLQ